MTVPPESTDEPLFGGIGSDFGEARSSLPDPPSRRRVARTIVYLDPRSMLKVSLAYAASLWLILVGAGIILWVVASMTGTIGRFEDFLAELLAESAFSINGFTLLAASGVLGFVILASSAILSVVTTVVFNVVAPITGGIRVRLDVSE